MKEHIIKAVQFFLFAFMMTMGFHLTYTILWNAIGLPLTDWTLWILAALSLLSEFGYMKWMVNS